ncbi:hypothetical protein M0R01_02395 [bacterium]|nr:hypothetical protein [bacterium]
MIKGITKLLVSAILLFLIIVLQSSIFPLGYLGFILGILFVLIFNLIEKSSSYSGVFVALWAGILIDIYSSSFFFGFYSIILMALAIIIKIVISKYVRIP